MSQDMEREPRRRSFGHSAFSAFSEAHARIYTRRMVADCLREAQAYERRVTELTEADGAKRGKIMLATGQAYLNARRPAEALTHLETARPYLETHKTQGSRESFFDLASLFQAMEAAYRGLERSEEADLIHAEAVDLAAQIEEHFGTVTTFLPDGSRVTAPPSLPLEAASLADTPLVAGKL